eukprot:TRINITY_DN20247_c0_g1_i1.p1 TRINITY_DN20247_c0_g1~~TRINITY_DN20247_c0_g1_i1.p1  ORF type:complete len:178 (-),score=41.40 TRINITY_DN20247_c0_g1_i1:19-528(-)
MGDHQESARVMERVLERLGMSEYGVMYVEKLRQHSLLHVNQLRRLDSGEWKILEFPSVIEEALKQEVNRLEQASASKNRGFDLSRGRKPKPEPAPKKKSTELKKPIFVTGEDSLIAAQRAMDEFDAWPVFEEEKPIEKAPPAAESAFEKKNEENPIAELDIHDIQYIYL